MRLSAVPDLRPARRLLLAALGVTVLVGVVLALKLDVRQRFGDTDDAMRLVIVRDLLAGRGWYDQWFGRLQPPWGMYMHWSRLVDGGIAGLIVLLRLAFSASSAEWLARVIWPIAWMLPAVTAALWLARNLGARSAVLVTAVLLVIDLTMFRQFIPGRIDHHNIQITMAMIAMAGATTIRRPALWAAVSGGATALGLAVGLEALPLLGLVGAAFALRLAADRTHAGAAMGYGLTLALASITLFLVQTPPWRWSVPACDALGSNLVCTLAVAGIGLAVAARAARNVAVRIRVALVAGVGLATLGAYLALDPACIHGPFAAVEPRARTLWLDGVEEVQPLWVIFRLDRVSAIDAVVTMVMGLAAAAFLLADARRRSHPLILIAAALGLACVMGVQYWRTIDYVDWIAVPLIGAAVSRLAARRLRELLVPTLAASVVLSPTSLAVAANSAATAVDPQPIRTGHMRMERCFAPAAFQRLSALPQGLVLSEPDMGPFILAFTSHSAVSGPYHRGSHAVVLTLDALDAPIGQAQSRVRALAVTYVVDCRQLPLVAASGSLGARLRAGAPPAWLEPLSAPGATLGIWRVRPASGAAGPA
jgi:hypothetical protein